VTSHPLEERPARPMPAAAIAYMVALLSLANAVGFIDRQALPLLIGPIEADLHLSDTQISLVVGAAFVISWSLLGLLAGVIVDRVNRKIALAVGAVIWGVMTISCGWAHSFLTLCLGRMGVGIGESIAGPASVSLIKDGVGQTGRGRALAVYALGASFGAGLALLGGGALLALFKDAPTVTVPILGVMRTWQAVLAAFGLLPFPLAILLLTMRDPGRHTTTAERRTSGGLGAAFQFVRQHWAVFLPLFMANGSTIVMIVSYQTWQPTMFARTWHLSRPQIGLGLGQLVAGVLIDWLEGRGSRRAPAIAGVWVTVAAALPAIFSAIAPSLKLAWILAIAYAFTTTAFFTIGVAAIARLSPNRLVGRLSSFHFIWVGVVGTALGPLTIAVVSEKVFSGPHAIGASMAAVSSTLDVVALICFIWLVKAWPAIDLTAQDEVGDARLTLEPSLQ
jgi:MFS family permease